MDLGRIGIFPERLKYTTIVPVYKKGDKNIVTNYRPISILTSLNKIFEKVMYGCWILLCLSHCFVYHAFVSWLLSIMSAYMPWFAIGGSME
jgi:hypothetical protein